MNKEKKIVVYDSIKKGDILMVKQALENEPNAINEVTPFGSWLQAAASYGQYEIADYLIKSGIDVNYIGSVAQNTAITQAAFKGHLEVVKLLYANGAIFNVSTADCNPLFAAIYNRHVDVAKYLIDKGIDLSANYPIGKLDKVDAYEYARQYGLTEIVEYIKLKMES